MPKNKRQSHLHYEKLKNLEIALVVIAPAIRAHLNAIEMDTPEEQKMIKELRKFWLLIDGLILEAEKAKA